MMDPFPNCFSIWVKRHVNGLGPVGAIVCHPFFPSGYALMMRFAATLSNRGLRL
jgi:hypothetical protein